MTTQTTIAKLYTRINELATTIGVAIKGVKDRVGDLSGLSTTDKTSVVDAINELDTSIKTIFDKIKPSNLISKDTDNTLTLGSDNKLKATGGSSKPTITTLNRKASQYFKFVGQYALGEGKFIPVYVLAISKFIDASRGHTTKVHTLMEGGNLTVEIPMSRSEGEGVLVASEITERHNLSDTVDTYLKVSGDKLIINLSHVGEYLSTQQNKAVNGQLFLYGEQLLSTITINYRLMSPKAALESLTEYFTVENYTLENYGEDSFNIAFDNWDLGGSQLPEGMDSIDIELLGVTVNTSFNLFGNFNNTDTRFYGLTAKELGQTQHIDYLGFTGRLTGIRVSWQGESIIILATNY